jgi:drug/metabolite transporter (DMT)-like permease
MTIPMNKRRIIFSVLLIIFGIFAIVYGEIDDSPGGQFLGLLAIIIGIVAVATGKKNSS